MLALDLIGIRAGTDKSRLRQDYLRQYQRIFAPFVERPITIVEIGVHHGASLEIWKQFFPLAEIVALDIEPLCVRFAADRVAIEIGSQYDEHFLQTITARYKPDIIIDDGSHIPTHQIFSFQHLFGSMAEGGVYVVEDLSADPADEASEYFSALQKDVLQRRRPMGVFRTETFPGAMAMWKAPSADWLDGNFNEIEKEVRRSERPAEALIYMAEYLRRHGQLEKAHAAGIEAVQMVPSNQWFKFEVAQCLNAMGRRNEAIEYLQPSLAAGLLPNAAVEMLKTWRKP